MLPFHSFNVQLPPGRSALGRRCARGSPHFQTLYQGIAGEQVRGSGHPRVGVLAGVRSSDCAREGSHRRSGNLPEGEPGHVGRAGGTAAGAEGGAGAAGAGGVADLACGGFAFGGFAFGEREEGRIGWREEGNGEGKRRGSEEGSGDRRGIIAGKRCEEGRIDRRGNACEGQSEAIRVLDVLPGRGRHLHHRRDLASVHSRSSGARD